MNRPGDVPYKEVLKKPTYLKKQEDRTKKHSSIKMTDFERMKRENEQINLDGFLKEK